MKFYLDLGDHVRVPKEALLKQSLYCGVYNGQLILIFSHQDCFTNSWEAPVQLLVVQMLLPVYIQGRSQHSGVTSIDTFLQLLRHGPRFTSIG